MQEELPAIVCNKCWWRVETFHEFYTRIEELHKTNRQNGRIFVSTLDGKVEYDIPGTPRVDSKDDIRELKTEVVATNILTEALRTSFFNEEEAANQDDFTNDDDFYWDDEENSCEEIVETRKARKEKKISVSDDGLDDEEDDDGNLLLVSRQ